MKRILSLLIMLPLLVIADDDNKVDVNTTGSQSNDSLVFNLTQIGYNNDTVFTIGGSNNSFLIKQEGNNNEISFVDYWGSGETWGGDLDGNNNALHFDQNCTRGSSCGKSDIGFHIQGNDNSVRWGQGRSLANASDETFSTDLGSEGGNHKLNLDIHGNTNSVVGFQRNGAMNQFSGHTATLYIYANDNSLWVKQENDGAKTLNYTSRTDDNTGHIVQKGSGSHTSTINLTGTYPSTLNLLQDSSTNQSYTLTQNCVTVGGCSVTITQE